MLRLLTSHTCLEPTSTMERCHLDLELGEELLFLFSFVFFLKQIPAAYILRRVFITGGTYYVAY